MSEQVTPYKDSNLGKKEQVTQMFDTISGNYDGLNRVISFGIDVKWRKKVLQLVSEKNPENILDIATGTGDLAILMTKTNAKKIIGLDISEGMLEVGKKKIAERKLDTIIEMVIGDSEQMPFADNHFDAVLCAYGVRNFQDLPKGLSEMCRVMRAGGRLAILEFSQPKTFPVKQVFSIYFKYVMPLFGKMVSKHSTAYNYLPESVMAFPEGQDFCKILEQCGYKNVKARPLTFGITSLYTAEK